MRPATGACARTIDAYGGEAAVLLGALPDGGSAVLTTKKGGFVMANIVRRTEGGRQFMPSPATGWDPFRVMRELLNWDPFAEMAPYQGEERAVGFLPHFEVKET